MYLISRTVNMSFCVFYQKNDFVKNKRFNNKICFLSNNSADSRKTSNPSSSERFVVETAAMPDDEIAEKIALNINEDRIKNERIVAM